VRICKTNSLGKANGIYKLYYPDGKLWYEVNYIDDKFNGIYKSYNYNGQLKEEVNYIDGKKV
jgi:antitoxin component YwqK of YwqJK toxin-antitoxin module